MRTARGLIWRDVERPRTAETREAISAGTTGAVIGACLTFSGPPEVRASGATPLITQPIDERDLVTLGGNTRSEANPANDLGAVDPGMPLEHLELQLRRSAEQEQQIERFIEALHNPASPSFHHWLSADEFGERFGAADERTAIVLRTKRLDPKRSLGSARHRLYAGGFAIAAHRVAQAVIDGLRIQQRVNKRLAVAHRQFDLLVFLNRPPCSILDAGRHEICDRPSLEGGGMFDKRLLLRRHSRLKALRAGATAGRFRGYVCHGDTPTANVRPMPGHFKS